MATEPGCIFCIHDQAVGTPDVDPARIIKAYPHWWLIVALPEKRLTTVQAAGLLVPKQHYRVISEIPSEQFGEIPSLLHDASAELCKAVGAEYTNQTRIGFNEGQEAGQTVMHAHIHILPVSKSDPEALKQRAGIGGAFEALRIIRLSDKGRN